MTGIEAAFIILHGYSTVVLTVLHCALSLYGLFATHYKCVLPIKPSIPIPRQPPFYSIF